MLKRVISPLSLFASALFLISNSYAMAPGLYLGLALGPASNTGSQMTAYTINYQVVCPILGMSCTPIPPPPPAVQTPFTSQFTASPKSTMFGSGVMLGYQFNDYAAAELGFNYFSTIRYTTNYIPTPTAPSCSSPVVPPGAPPGGAISVNPNRCNPSTGIGVRSGDIVFKGSIPLKWFNLYGKIGPAYVVTNTEGGFSPPVFINNQLPGRGTPVNAKSTTKTAFKPIFGIGADYTLTQNWVADLSWTHLSVGNNAGTVNFFALGIAYHFVDIFCGQFLCND